MAVIYCFADYRAAARRKLAGVELRLVRADRPWPPSAPRAEACEPIALRCDGPFPFPASPWRAAAEPRGATEDRPRPGDDQV